MVFKGKNKLSKQEYAIKVYDKKKIKLNELEDWKKSLLTEINISR